jgi:FkbM family methyltransferase
MLKAVLKRLARRLGYVIATYDPRRDPIAIRKRLFATHDINLVFDVGANAGQFARYLRGTGYQRGIVSFEPMSAAYELLKEAARQDSNWKVKRCALGAVEGNGEINISGNSWSSSLLDMAEVHAKAVPESTYVDKELIEITTLDAVYTEYANEDTRSFLKIDTQGYTKQVLDGAQQSLKKIKGILVEMSLVELYLDEPLIGDVLTLLYDKGYTLVAIEPEFFDPKTDQLLQVNGLFSCC